LNKKAVLFVILMASLVATPLTIPVQAATFDMDSLDYVTYHGYTTSWDRGDSETVGSASASYDTSEGEIGTSASDGGYAWAYLNSGAVYAGDDVDNIRVTIWYTWYDCWEFTASISIEVRLYVCGNYQDSIIIEELSSSGWEDFSFTGLNVQYDDDLDIDIIMTSASLGQYSYAINCADYSYVAFTSD